MSPGASVEDFSAHFQLAISEQQKNQIKHAITPEPITQAGHEAAPSLQV